MRRIRTGCALLGLLLAGIVIGALGVFLFLPSDRWPQRTTTRTPAVARAQPSATAVISRRAPTEPPVPTVTFRPVSTPTAAPRRAATPTNTSQAQPPAVVNADTLNVRTGPGTNYPVVTQVHRGDPLTVTGRNEPADWLQVVTPDDSTGWVSAAFVDLHLDLDGVPVVEVPPTPTPAAPTPTLTVDEQLAKIAAGKHGVLPPPAQTGGGAGGGEVEVTIINDTPHELTVLVGSPNSRTIVLERCPTCKHYMIQPLTCQKEGRPQQTVRLQPGTMDVGVTVDDKSVIPFLGTWDLKGDGRYISCFFIVTKLR